MAQKCSSFSPFYGCFVFWIQNVVTLILLWSGWLALQSFSALFWPRCCSLRPFLPILALFCPFQGFRPSATDFCPCLDISVLFVDVARLVILAWFVWLWSVWPLHPKYGECETQQWLSYAGPRTVPKPSTICVYTIRRIKFSSVAQGQVTQSLVLVNAPQWMRRTVYGPQTVWGDPPD